VSSRSSGRDHVIRPVGGTRLGRWVRHDVDALDAQALADRDDVGHQRSPDAVPLPVVGDEHEVELGLARDAASPATARTR
jgi:hypothetical protein